MNFLTTTSFNTFTANTKAKSAEVNSNFTTVKNAISSFSYDAKFGTIALQTSPKSADYTVQDNDGIHTILMTTGASNRTVTLPTAADNSDRIIKIKKVDSGAGFCTIDGEGAETIDGAATYKLMLQYEGVTLACDGSNWHITEYFESKWTSWTVVASWTTNITWVGYWRKVGKMAQFAVHGTLSGAPTAAALTINHPSGVSTDTGVMPGTGSGSEVHHSSVNLVDESGTPDVFYGGSVVHNTGGVAVRADDGAQYAAVTNSVPLPWTSNDIVSLRYNVPIVTT